MVDSILFSDDAFFFLEGEIDSYCIVFDLNSFFISLQQAHRRGNGRLPPPWALVAMAVLGFDEIMMLLRYAAQQYAQGFLTQTKNY